MNYRRVVYLRQGGFAADLDHPNATTKVSIDHPKGVVLN